MTQDEYFKTDEFQETLHLYQEAVRHNDELFLDAADLTDIAEYYYTASRRAEALQALDHALRMYPHEVLPLSYKARIVLWEENNPGKALQILSKAEDKAHAEYFIVRGELLLASDRLEEAEESFRQYYNSFDTYEQEGAAMDVLSLLVDYDLPHLFPQWAGRCVALTEEIDNVKVRAALLFYNGDYQEAQDGYEKIVEQDPFDAASWYKLSLCAHEMKNPRRALEAIDFALAINPNDRQLLTHKAFTLMELNNYRDAGQMLDKLYDRMKDPATLLLPMMICKIEQGKADEGRSLLQSVMKKADPTDKRLADVLQSCADLLKQSEQTAVAQSPGSCSSEAEEAAEGAEK